MQTLDFIIAGTIARSLNGNIVNDDNGVFRLKIKDGDTLNGKLVYRINTGLSHSVSLKNGMANIPTNSLSAGILYIEIYIDDPARKVICEALEIRSYFEENKNRFTANAKADDILLRLAEVERKTEEAQKDYEAKYNAVTEKLEKQTALLEKISKSFTLGLF